MLLICLRPGDEALDVAANILSDYINTGVLSGSDSKRIFYSDSLVSDDRVFDDINSVHWCMEAISYFTAIPEFKEKIVHHSFLLNNMITLILRRNFESDPINPGLSVEDSNRDPEIHAGQRARCGAVGDFGFVAAIFNLTFDPSLALSPDEREKVEQLEMIHQKAGMQEKRVHELDRTALVRDRTHRLFELNVGKALSHIGRSAKRMTDFSKEMLAGSFLHLTRIEKKRGQLIADGAIHVLTQLGTNAETKCRNFAGQALAKIFISENPNIALKNGAEYNVIPVLFHLLTATDEALPQFESLLALTNLASMDFTVADAIVSGKKLSLIESFHHENHTELRRVATELLCNLTLSDGYINALRGAGGATRILILTKFVFEDDSPTADAAMAVLARTCGDPFIQKHLLGHAELDCFAYGIEAERPESLQHRTVFAISILSESSQFVDQFLLFPSLHRNLQRMASLRQSPMATLAASALQHFPDSAHP